MGFVVTEEMTDEFKVRLNRNFGSPTMLTGQCYQDALQCLVDRHNLAPASAVEEVDDKTLVRIMNRYHAMDCCPWDWAADMRDAVRSLGLRIVRDAKPAASFGRRTPPLNLPDDDGFCSVGGLTVDLGLYKSSDAKPVPADDAAKRGAKDATIAELAKRIDALEINQGLTKGAIAGFMGRVDVIGDSQRKADELINEMRNQILNIADCVDALEADNPEPETVAAERVPTNEELARDFWRYKPLRGSDIETIFDCGEDDTPRTIDDVLAEFRERIEALESRNSEPETVAEERTFTEAEVREAMRYAVDVDEQSAAAVAFTFNFAEHLGINPEATK